MFKNTVFHGLPPNYLQFLKSRSEESFGKSRELEQHHTNTKEGPRDGILNGWSVLSHLASLHRRFP